MSWSAVRAWRPSRIGLRLLAFNLLVVFVPVIGVLYLSVYEAHLLHAQERAMVQQGRVLAAALGAGEELDATSIERLFVRLERRNDARYRVYGVNGEIVADSGRAGAPAAPEESARYGASDTPAVRDRWLYRVGAWLARARDWLRPAVEESRTGQSDGTAPELRAALAGRYGAASHRTAGQRSITLTSAIPIRHDGTVIGAVLVSQSTFRILQALYDVRLRVFEVVVASLVAAALLTALATMTIVRPLAQLRARASALAERRGPRPSGFPGSRRKDELGALARALDELTHRTNDHIRLLQSFAADVSHEFKNPIASIRTAAEMMADADTEADRRRFLHLMTRDVDRLERLVSGLRDVAIVEEQIEHEATERVDLDRLLDEIVNRLQTIAQRGVTVAIVRDPADHQTRGSRERLAQVFDNLLANALSFAPDGSAIEVGVAAGDGGTRITIDDSGPGIPEAHLQRVFDRFFTYRPAQGRGDHAGLGLAIAKQIVERYGGRITAANRSGGGARFEVNLPSAR